MTQSNSAPNSVKSDEHSWLEMARRVLLAGVGAIVLAQEEVEAFVNMLVERGEIAERDGRQLIQDSLQERQQVLNAGISTIKERVTGKPKQQNSEVNQPVSSVEIETLSQKIEKLSKQVDDLLA